MLCCLWVGDGCLDEQMVVGLCGDFSVYFCFISIEIWEFVAGAMIKRCECRDRVNWLHNAAGLFGVKQRRCSRRIFQICMHG